MYDLSRLFWPIAAAPGGKENHIEVPPSDILKPYIRCFWGSPRLISAHEREGGGADPSMVIPDACMDVIAEFDARTNTFSHVFCGINDAPFIHHGFRLSGSVFAIRFYFWAAHLFSDASMKSTLNAFNDPQTYFSGLKSVLENVMLDKASIHDRIPPVEDYLVHRLNRSRKTNNDLLNAVHSILQSRGVITVGELCSSTALSERQLERIFLEHTGVSPKKAADLVRFQNTLREILTARNRDFPDIVYKYGFTDQPHMINNFRKYAGRTPQKTLEDFK